MKTTTYLKEKQNLRNSDLLFDCILSIGLYDVGLLGLLHGRRLVVSDRGRRRARERGVICRLVHLVSCRYLC